MTHRCAAALLASALVACAAPAADRPFRYPEGTHGNGSLRYVNGVPVLTVEGTPEQMGEQIGVLAARPARALMKFPRDFLDRANAGYAWPVAVLACKGLYGNVPERYRREIEAIGKASGIDRDSLIVANTLFDLYKGLGCSTLTVDPARSATGGPLFGRNLDYPSLGYVHRYSLVTVYKPKGRRSFASVGFPGLAGCLSGINDRGLSLAILEVYASGDGAPKLDVRGTPYAMLYRDLLETCGDRAEAEKRLTAAKRTTMTNLALCDRSGGAVFEITPASVVVRGPAGAMTACTNHFRTPALAVDKHCRRYDALLRDRRADAERGKVGIPEISRRLHAANQGELTIQTMIFEPAVLRLHVAFGKLPSSAQPMRTVDLAPLFGVAPLAGKAGKRGD